MAALPEDMPLPSSPTSSPTDILAQHLSLLLSELSDVIERGAEALAVPECDRILRDAMRRLEEIEKRGSNGEAGGKNEEKVKKFEKGVIANLKLRDSTERNDVNERRPSASSSTSSISVPILTPLLNSNSVSPASSSTEMSTTVWQALIHPPHLQADCDVCGTLWHGATVTGIVAFFEAIDKATTVSNWMPLVLIALYLTIAAVSMAANAVYQDGVGLRDFPRVAKRYAFAWKVAMAVLFFVVVLCRIMTPSDL